MGDLATKNRIGLTGTLMQNNFEELWCLVNFIVPDCLGTLQKFRANYINPLKNGQKFDATYSEIAKKKIRAKQLFEKIQNIMIRRTKSQVLTSDDV